ncbi:MAG: hypothetical protein AMJ62_11965 [Myxococcales bacterium SG8_38]|nr:MAG: hypothetical protein AMJ62_11965 [Myxococcales bacterium SG8_38]
MSQSRDFADATKCPLCGEANACAIAAGQGAEMCWCMSVVIDPEAIARIPAEAQGKVCICERCARGAADTA